MDPRTRNRQVATDKSAKEKGATEDAVIIDTVAADCYSLWEDVSGHYREIAGLSSLEP